MKRLAFALCLALLVHPAVACAASDSAPADEYFGAYHLSVLGMRNALRDLAAYGSEQGPRVYRKLVVVEDAVAEWRERFPADPWLPKLGLRLGRLFSLHLDVEGSAQHEHDVLGWVAEAYPDSPESVLAANLLAANDVDNDDPNVPIAAYIAAPAARVAPVRAPSMSSDPSSEAPRASVVAESPAPRAHSATVPIVAGVVVAGAAAWLLTRHH
jgi:hypothetical protein